jgi:hypothetical protein
LVARLPEAVAEPAHAGLLDRRRPLLARDYGITDVVAGEGGVAAACAEAAVGVAGAHLHSRPPRLRDRALKQLPSVGATTVGRARPE